MLNVRESERNCKKINNIKIRRFSLVSQIYRKSSKRRTPLLIGHVFFMQRCPLIEGKTVLKTLKQQRVHISRRLFQMF